MTKYQCTVCNFVYDTEKEKPKKIKPLPEDWVCVSCGICGRDIFVEIE
ncbi:rubredoxin [Candidatus Methanoperedens nitroreducens]|uniref:Rubredoxin n=2 Tax=Candidatus Methanoperedens nitratireducens TaxID=1392998 RepID=A0A062V4L5_9EURY|nr:rubredoxin [Candidatus Methanoperedens nitroreducens]